MTLKRQGEYLNMPIVEDEGTETLREKQLLRRTAPEHKPATLPGTRVKFTTEATIVEVSDAKGWYYTKCCAKITQQFTDPQCRDHGPQPIPNYGIVIDDRTSTATVTRFSLEAHTFVPECNEVENVVEDKDTCHVPNALKQVENNTYIFHYHIGKGAKPGDPDFNLDASLKSTTQPILRNERRRIMWLLERSKRLESLTSFSLEQPWLGTGSIKNEVELSPVQCLITDVKDVACGNDFIVWLTSLKGTSITHRDSKQGNVFMIPLLPLRTELGRVRSGDFVVVRMAISTDHGLYTTLEETLKVFIQWLCVKCMTLHAVSQACHPPDGLVYFSKEANDMSGYIVGISKPSNKESDIEVWEGLALDAELLDRVFKLPITTVKSIPHGIRLAFSQALKNSSLQGSLGKGGAAVKVLSSSGLASYCDDTIKALEAKHPYKPPLTMSSNTFFKSPLVAEIDCVFGCIKYFPKGTSCRRDGLRAQHILDALCGEGSATATNLLKAITSVVNLWLAWRCPPILVESIASAPLTPLLKLDNGIRPIAVGTIWRRLASKVAIKGVGKDMSKYLGDFQFGVRVSGGAEAILHSVNRVLSKYHNDGPLAMLTVDFSNVFNLVDRSALLYEVRVQCPFISLWVDFLYGQALRLYTRDTHIWSATGLLLHAWYLDDGTVIGDSKEVSKVLDIIKVSGPGLGLELNIKKTEIFWPLCNGIKLREGLFPVDIWRPSLGVRLLGGAVSRDADFISGLAMRRAANVADLMSLLP
ncbi:hypothetical protein Tco_1326810 [Tanacetum coccineum]